MDLNEFKDLVRICAERGQVIYTDHAQQRMVERDVSRIMVEGCLKSGQCVGRPQLDEIHGTYVCKLSHYMGGTSYEVVVANHPDMPDAIIVTVINKEDGYV